VRGPGQDEFDDTLSVWPSDHNYRNSRCPRGHVLALGGRSGGYDHDYRATVLRCAICGHDDIGAGTWALIDPTAQVPESAATGQGMELVVFPPPVRAGVGRIELRLRGHVLGDIDLTLCGVDRRGVIEHVRVDPPRRRLGYSRLLVAAARARGVGFTWTTTKVQDTFEARAFWARIGWPGVGEPFYCSHMSEAAGFPP